MICKREGCESSTEGSTFFCPRHNFEDRKKERDEAKENDKRKRAEEMARERAKKYTDTARAKADELRKASSGDRNGDESIPQLSQKYSPPNERKKSSRINHYSKAGRKVKEAEWQMFREIWSERPHFSEISGAYLGEEYNPSFFAHIVAKGSYEGLRLKKNNICLMTPGEHNLYDKETDKAKQLTEYQWVFQRKQELIEWFYEQV